MRFAVWCLLLVSLLACADGNIKSAGVIAVAEQNGVRYILLADHTGASAHRGYGAFGGGLDKGESIQAGALREFHEETACHFVDKVESISEQYVRNKAYASFVVTVPYIDEATLNAGPAVNNCDGGVFSERANWVWVPQQALLQQLKTGNEFKNNALDLSLWDKSTIIIKKSQQQNLLN